jgi:5'-nucleotidase (lipoprotein e(P4) family)
MGASMKKRIQQVFLPVLVFLAFSGHEWPSIAPSQTDRNEHLVMPVLWFQRSAEMRALSYQAFNLARLRLDEDRALNKGVRKRAVVVDIDETLLNNSPHMGKLIKENGVFPYAWTEWVNRAEAEPLPGTLEFLTYAVSKDYDVFYVSNRSAKTETAGTAENLKKKGFPQVLPDHIMLKEEQSSKEGRRNAIEKTHEIVLLIGDNLNDLASVFEKKSVDDRAGEVDKVKDQFGNRFIVLPNPMYGDWENAVYEYRRGLSDKEKDELRRSALKYF